MYDDQLDRFALRDGEYIRLTPEKVIDLTTINVTKAHPELYKLLEQVAEGREPYSHL